MRLASVLGPAAVLGMLLVVSVAACGGDDGGSAGGSAGSSAGHAGAGGTSGGAGTGGAAGVSGTGGAAGASGSGGSAGVAGSGGAAGVAGSGGTSGTGGQAGTSGTGGAAGASGTGGQAGTAGTGGAVGVWQPPSGTSWQWQLTGTLDTSVDVAMYDIDMEENDASTIASLQAAGRVVICYFSAGSFEDWRSDASEFPSSVIGNDLDGWPGERWLDTRSSAVRDIMSARLDRAVQKGCDGVEPDNVDGYQNDPGFPLTGDTQLDYNRFIANEAHARGLSVGLKNDLDQVDALVDDFDWALNEECYQWDECEMLVPFIQQGKAVFHVEYGNASLADEVCPVTSPMGFSTLIKNLDLDAWRVACP